MSEAKLANETIAPVRKTISVLLPPADAFRLFTEGLGKWWPLASHSIAGDRAATCVLEGRAGGRIYEVDEDGVEAEWGVILAWEPPRRFVMSWHPGRADDTAQEVEVVFKGVGPGTRVTLEHRHWELLGARAEATRAEYVTGWDIVLAGYIRQAEVDNE